MKNLYDEEIYTKNKSAYEIYYSSIRKYPVLENDEVKYLFSLYRKNKDQKAKNDLINCHLRLATKYAWKYSFMFKRLDISDLVQEANLILLKSIEVYATRNINCDFHIYLRSQLKYGMYNLLNTSDDLFRIPASVKSDYRKVKQAYEFIRKYGRNENITNEKILAITGLTEKQYKRVSKLTQEIVYLDKELDDDKKSTYKDFLEDPIAPDLHEMMIEKEIKQVCNEALKFLTTQEKNILLQTMQRDFIESDLDKIAINNFLNKEDVVKIQKRAIRKLRQNQKVSSYKEEVM